MRETDLPAAGQPPQLGRRAVRGGVTVVAGQAVARLATASGILVLAGILVPEDFGLVAIASLLVAGASTAVAFGPGMAVQSLPRSADLDRTAIALAVALGGASAAILVIAAPWLSAALGDVRAAPLVRAMAVVVVIDRWVEVRLAILERELKFRSTVVIQTGSALAGASVGVVTGLLGFGAWALVLQRVTTDASTGLALALHPGGTRRPGWRRQEVGRLLAFGREVATASIVIFLFNYLDDASVARLAGAVALGIYAFAYQLSNLPTYVITHALSRVSLPVYAKLYDDRVRWGETYRGLVRVLAWGTGLLMFGVMIHGPPVLSVIYGDRWGAAYPVMQVLALYGLARATGATTGTVFVALRRPELMRRIATWQTVGMVVMLLPLTARYGALGAAIAATAAMVSGAGVALWHSMTLLDVDPRRIGAELVLIWAGVAAANLAGVPVVRSLGGGWTGLAVGGLVVVGLGVAFGCWRVGAELREAIRAFRSSRD